MNGKTKRRSPQVTLFNNKLGLSRAFETLQPLNPISKHQNKFRMQRRTQNLKEKPDTIVFLLLTSFSFMRFLSHFYREVQEIRDMVGGMASAIEMKTARRRFLPSFFSGLSCSLSHLSFPFPFPYKRLSRRLVLSLRLNFGYVQILCK